MANTTEQTIPRNDAPLAHNGNGVHLISRLADEFNSAESQADLASIANKLRERLDADTSVLSPKVTGENPVEIWLSAYKENFLKLLPELIVEQYPNLKSKYDQELEKLAGIILPKIEDNLREYALRRLALRWSARRYPNATRLGVPERDGDNYIVPVFSLNDNSRIGSIVLNRHGVVQPETTTGAILREAFLRAA